MAQTAALADAVHDARQGIITHLTADGERVAAIVPEPVLAALLRAAEDIPGTAGAAWDDPADDIAVDYLGTGH